ncbi:MAG: cytochrome c-type biogenesis CcmF C-terminal domain-containing protein [Phycisphaerae bacterium]
MMTMIGTGGLIGALCVAVLVMALGVIHAVLASGGQKAGEARQVHSASDVMLRLMRFLMGVLAVLVSASSWGLLSSLLDNNFALSYVARNSDRALPLGYKIAAFWAGQEGSLLFWAWVLGLMGVGLAFALRKRDTAETSIALAVMAAVTGFFVLLMLSVKAADPFVTLPLADIPLDGRGLNPILQNFAMVLHPPILFIGYAGFTPALALLAGALIAGRRDSDWLSAMRPWLVVTWVALTVGIILGAQWAYMELGWGGYWAWDPVENASLLPWLTGTALLHSVAMWRKRGMFKLWTAFLTAGSFLLCIFGTYLTRSGVLKNGSMHTFEESGLGAYFLVFMALVALASLILILLRLKLLRGEHELEALISREGTVMAGNVLLVTMMVVTLYGTVRPIFSSAGAAMGGDPGAAIEAARPYYNRLVLPMALLLGAIMATGPVLGYGTSASTRVLKLLGIMGLVGVLVAGLMAAFGYSSGFLSHSNPTSAVWTMCVAAVAAAVVAGVALDFGSTSWQLGRGNPVAGMVRALLITPRRWGAQVAHLGLAALIVGVAGSSLFNVNQNVVLKKSESVTVGQYTLTYQELHDEKRPTHHAVIAHVTVKDQAGKSFAMDPERRFYDKSEPEGQSASEVDIRMGLANDVYLNLAGWEELGTSGTFQVILNPLVNWIWIGGILMTLGGLICLLPQRLNRDATELAEAPALRIQGPTNARTKTA